MVKRYILLSLLAHVGGGMAFSVGFAEFRKADGPYLVYFEMTSPDGAGTGAGGAIHGSRMPRFGKTGKGPVKAGTAVPVAGPPTADPPTADPAPRPAGEDPEETKSASLGDAAGPDAPISRRTNPPQSTRETGGCAEGRDAGGAFPGRGGPGPGGGEGIPGAEGTGASIAWGTGHGDGGDVSFGSARGPSFLERSAPVYPILARRLGREGKVVLRLTIDEHGTLTELEVTEDPGYGFSEAAAEAVRKSRFAPARVNGRPIACKALLPVRFVLRGGS